MILKIISDHWSLCVSTFLVASSFWGFGYNQLFAHLGCKRCKKSSALPEFHLLASPSDSRWFKSSCTDPDADAISWKQSFGLSATGLENELVTTLILGPNSSKHLNQMDMVCLFLLSIFIYFIHYASSE